MTLAPMGPYRVDMIDRIACVIEPLQDQFRCDEVFAQNVWRLLEIYEHMEFDIPDLDRHHDIIGRGETYERKKEAAEITKRAFESAFGSAKSFPIAKGGALRAVLCETYGVIPAVKVTPEEIEQGKKFFREWYTEARDLLA